MERGAFKLLGGMEKSWWYRGRAAAVHAALAHCGANNAEDVLDFGAGYGGMHGELSKLGKNIYAFEPDEEARAAAKNRGYARVFSSENEALGRTYGLIGLFDVVEHIEHDHEFLIKARGALREGGRLAITVPAFQFLWSTHDTQHHHFRRYTIASMRAALNSAGYEVEYASYWNMTLFIPAAITRFLGRSGDSALSMPRLLDAIFFAIVKAESLLIRFVPLPVGTSLVVIARKKEKYRGLIQRIGERERKYAEEVLVSNFSNSKNVGMRGRFEKAFAEKFDVKYAVAHANGTMTLHAALFAAGVRAGDEVITTPLTMASPTMAILQADAVPVFADVVEDTFQIDPRSIEKLITPRTKAIMTVALYGLSPEMDDIMEIARKHNLMVIEDAAQTFQSTYKGKIVGSIGHLSSFSFQSTKHITAGEGGVVCTSDPEMADDVRRYCVLGYRSLSRAKGLVLKDDIQNPDYERHVQMGCNYRMPELCAAVALGQLEHSEELVQRRIDAAHLFIDAMANCEWLQPQLTPSHCVNSYWALAVRLTSPETNWTAFRKKFMELGGDGIYAAWRLTYDEPMFRKATRNFSGKEKVIEAAYKGKLQEWDTGLCPVAERVQKQILAFKTNYWDWDRAKKQAEILKRTIRYFASR